MELPPSEVCATCMVDYKMIKALQKGQFALTSMIQMWYKTDTIWKCKVVSICVHKTLKGLSARSAYGIMQLTLVVDTAVHYVCNVMKATEVHLWI